MRHKVLVASSPACAMSGFEDAFEAGSWGITFLYVCSSYQQPQEEVSDYSDPQPIRVSSHQDRQTDAIVSPRFLLAP